jgi:probable F420-dependent oxidoreductase
MGLRSVAVKAGRERANRDHALEFGFTLPSRGPLAQAPIVARLARTADALRYDVVIVSDHVVLPTKTSAPYPYAASGEFPGGAHQDYLEPLVSMGWLLALTQRIKVGVSVLVVPYRNPVVTAKQLATLDVLSGGRVVLGVGVGWWPEEFAALQAPPFAERGAVTDEYVRLMRTLWTEELPQFEGKYYRIHDVTMLPKPVQRTGPAIWVGGQTDRAIRRAAELGDAWHPIGLRGTAGLTPPELGEKVTRLREAAARAGRPADAVSIAFRAALELWGAGRKPPAGRPVPPPPLCGSAAKVIDDIRAYQAVGVRTFVFDFPVPDPKAMIETMRRFAREVRPKLARPARSGGRRAAR